MNRSYQDLKKLFKGQSLPAAFVDLDALDQNIQSVLQRAGNLPIRIASKSIRCRWILDYLFQSSPRFQGIMAYTVTEANWLAQNGQDDLLIAYPSQDLTALQEVCTQVSQGKRIYLMIDSLAQAQRLNQIARDKQVCLPICLDLDVSSDYPGLHFGVWRSPLRSLKTVQDLVTELKPLNNLRIAALMGYEAQIAGVGDAMPGQILKNKIIQKLQRHSLKEVLDRRQSVVHWLQEQGHLLDLVNGGGSGSLEYTAQDVSVTELTAGSAFYAPTLFDAYSHFKLQPAAGFAIPIVRQPRSDTFTALGGGYIASGAIGKDKQPSIWQPQGAQITALEGTGEVQTPIVYTGSEQLFLGDPVFLRHAKAGELCERFNHIHLIRGKTLFKTVPTYRGEGQCFL